VQRAVWRKRGSVSPESLCKFGSFVPVRTAVKAPPAPSRWDEVRYEDENIWVTQKMLAILLFESDFDKFLQLEDRIKSLKKKNENS
jgi:hypothetical protein